MAFGSFFKKIITGAKNIIGKVVPAVKKGIEVVSKLAPAVATGAAAFGGNIGNKISDIAGKVGNVANGVNRFMSNGPPPLLGANGAGRFALPLLK